MYVQNAQRSPEDVSAGLQRSDDTRHLSSTLYGVRFRHRILLHSYGHRRCPVSTVHRSKLAGNAGRRGAGAWAHRRWLHLLDRSIIVNGLA